MTAPSAASSSRRTTSALDVTPHVRASRWSAVAALFVHQLRRTRRSWSSVLVAGLATPTLFLFALGAGLGTQIEDAELAELGLDSYLDFIGPGVLIVTAMQIAASESMWPTQGLLRWRGIYQAIQATPITSGELGLAHLGWLGFRALVSAASFLVVLALAGAVPSAFGVAIVAVAVLVAWAHAGPLVALTVGLEQDNVYPMISRVVIFPLFLFSGAFFPVDDLPAVVGAFARITPSWHGVELGRHLALGDLSSADLVHAAYLVAVCAVGFWLVRRQFRKHLDR